MSDAESEWLSLRAWTLATVDIALFVVLALVGIHAVGGLDDLLAGLSTLVGVAAFLGLWALFVLAVRWALADASLAKSSLWTLAKRGLVAGSVAGLVTLLVLALVVVVPLVLVGPAEPLSGLLFTAIATPFAAVVGALVGLFFGAVDVALYRASGYALPAVVDERRGTPTTPDRP
ncbi:hypothetical protein [Haloarcula marina]|uniref:hypothetical protein n=1 Tax=Haloarcula marina TaxID=2961574 RepID=UPI0020B8AEC2|nr:hypothetical protein [Halomicroarcula marina]